MSAERLAAGLADRYRIERKLGAGGMATVYLAHDLRYDRNVAVKVLREELFASLGKERFLREITVAAVFARPDGANHIVVLQSVPELARRIARGSAGVTR